MSKRVKLKIQRHRLPTVDILWPLKDAPTNSRDQPTISSLLSDINTSIPLESGDWTLDQYTVELDGFECLHYQLLHDVLQNGDTLVIRPLTTPDVKARRLGGRTQITQEGFHILDGVPYGFQGYQRPARPGILIPGRKRRRPEMEEEEGDEDTPVTIADLEEDEDLLGAVNGGEGGGFQLSRVEEGGGEEEDAQGRPKKKQKNVHFKIVKDIPDFSLDDGEDEDEDDDEDFDPEAGAEESASEEEDEASGSDSDSVSSSDVSSTSSEESSDSDSDDSSSSDSDAESDASSKPEVLSSKAPPTPNGVKPPTEQPVATGVPYTGTKRTRSRNGRKRLQKRMIARVRSIIGENATAEECDAWMKANSTQANYIKLAAKDGLHDERDGSESEAEGAEAEDAVMENGADGDVNGAASAGAEDPASKVSMGDEITNAPETTTNGITATTEEEQPSKKKPKSKSSSFEEQRQTLLSAISSGGVVNISSRAPTSIADAEQAAAATMSKRSSPAVAESPDPKRARIGDASRRAIFGALGQRTPKTSQDAERVRLRLAGLNKKKEPEKAAEVAPEEEEEDPYSDAWRSKIILRAVDCDDPSITLSEPPYPFYQRWDVSQQLPEKGSWSKKRKRKARNSYGYGGDGGEDEEDYIELDYGDEAEGEDEYADGEEEMAELVEGQLLNEAEQLVYKDDLPSLPADLSTLPALTISDLKVGAIIAFRQLEVSQATNWSPTLSTHKTAEITSASDGSRAPVITVRLALRDRELKNIEYDKDGKRVYEKFEMDGEDEEEEDDGLREVMFEDMVEARLVRAGKDEGEDDGPGQVVKGGVVLDTKGDTGVGADGCVAI